MEKNSNFDNKFKCSKFYIFTKLTTSKPFNRTCTLKYKKPELAFTNTLFFNDVLFSFFLIFDNTHKLNGFHFVV